MKLSGGGEPGDEANHSLVSAIVLHAKEAGREGLEDIIILYFACRKLLLTIKKSSPLYSEPRCYQFFGYGYNSQLSTIIPLMVLHYYQSAAVDYFSIITQLYTLFWSCC